jgi:GntR family transcriptional regulator
MAEMISYSVNLDSPIAVYVQIENQIQFAIASARLKAGDTLPSVREMSVNLGVNPNTVTKAYRDLEIMGLVETRRGVGVSVTAKAPKLCTSATQGMVEEHLRDAVAECIAAGYSGSDIRSIVSETVEAQVTPYSLKTTKRV